MKLHAHQQARSSDNAAAAPLRWLSSLLALAGLASAATTTAAKKTTDIDTSTLLIPSVSTASGDHIHASVVSVADGDAGLTTLTLQCVNGGSACAQTAFAGQTYIYGPATASVALDHHTWSCAVSTSASSSAVCAYSADSTPAVTVTATASTVTVTGAAWHTAVTITSGVDKLRSKTTTTKTTKTSTTNASSPTATDGSNSNSGLCKRVTKGHGAGDDDADADSVGSTTPKSGSGSNTDDDADDSSKSGSSSSTTTKNPCSGASSRWGLDTSLVGTMAVISGLGLVILGLEVTCHDSCVEL